MRRWIRRWLWRRRERCVYVREGLRGGKEGEEAGRLRSGTAIGGYNRATMGHQELFRARLVACGYSTHAGGESGSAPRMPVGGCGPAPMCCLRRWCPSGSKKGRELQIKTGFSWKTVGRTEFD